MKQTQDQRSYVRLFQDAGWRLVVFLAGFLVDAAIGSLIFVSLIWFAWLIGVARAAGVKPEHLEVFGETHFWLNYGLFVIIALALGTRAIKGIFRD